MNSKMILLTGLLVTVFMSLIIYGFLVYSLYKDTTTNQTGETLVKNKQLLFYFQLAAHLLVLGFSAGVFLTR